MSDISSSNYENEIARLATLSDISYAQERRATAKMLNIRVTELDKLVKKQQKQQFDDPVEMFETIEPWLEPVLGESLVDELEKTFERFSVLPTGSALIASLWTILSY